MGQRPAPGTERTGEDVDQLATLHEAGQTALALGATFGLADQQRAEAAELVARLHAAGAAY